MQRHCENGKVIANFLKNHPKVGDVYWPGFQEITQTMRWLKNKWMILEEWFRLT